MTRKRSSVESGRPYLYSYPLHFRICMRTLACASAVLIAGLASDPRNGHRSCSPQWLWFQEKRILTTWVQVEPKTSQREYSAWNFNIQMTWTLISQHESFSKYYYWTATRNHSNMAAAYTANKEIHRALATLPWALSSMLLLTTILRPPQNECFWVTFSKFSYVPEL